MRSSVEHGPHTRSSDGRSLDEQARQKGVHPIRSVDNLACDGIFETDKELDEFLAHLAELRRTDLG
jgi:hypothetical protein